MAITNECEDCGSRAHETELYPYSHADGGTILLPRCLDRKGCQQRRREERAALSAEALAEVRDAADNLAAARLAVEVATSELGATIRRVLAEGVAVTAAAGAAGLSRERVYQIRDGRR